MPVPETVDVQIVGPYHGPHTSGASDDVVEVCLSRFYTFDDFGVRINCIPAKRDNATGRIYVSAPIAKRVHATVREVEETMERIRTDKSNALLSMRPNFSLNAAEFLSDAA